MSVRILLAIQLGLLMSLVERSLGDEPRPIPLTRPEMKALLEDVKQRTPRIPLPEPTAAEREQLGERAENYESRLRYNYLGQSSAAPSRGANASSVTTSTGGPPSLARNADPNMTLTYPFKVELFWIVSRTNNCQYCLGHQESKLLGAGASEDRIASLDGDWQEFTERERTAYAFARKVTLEPHTIREADIDALRVHFSPEQIIEMIVSIAWNNSINRWKEGVGVPQSPDEGGYSRLARMSSAKADEVESMPRGSYLTPTSPKFAKTVTRVAPVQFDDRGEPTTVCAMSKRPPLEPRDVVLEKLAECRSRQSRLPLLDPPTTRQNLELDEDAAIENWMRLLAHFPQEGRRRVQAFRDASQSPDLDPLTLARISWIVGRQDRAWYVVERAYRDLKNLGQSDDQIFSLDGDWAEYSTIDQSLFQIAKHLSASPVVLTDSEVARGVEQAGPAKVVQLINFVTQCAALNRIAIVADLGADS